MTFKQFYTKFQHFSDVSSSFLHLLLQNRLEKMMYVGFHIIEKSKMQMRYDVRM